MVIANEGNYKTVLPVKKWEMFLEYLKTGFADDVGDMVYDEEKDQFQLNNEY